MLRLYRTAVSGRVRTSYTPACGGCATVPRSRSGVIWYAISARPGHAPRVSELSLCRI